MASDVSVAIYAKELLLSLRRHMPETEQQFIKNDVFTMAGETVQSFLVPSTILGRELLDLVLPAQAHHGIAAKLLHGVSAINKSAPVSAQWRTRRRSG